jgi:hypothetical protein
MPIFQATMQILATLACAIFAGAAIYINLVEHPARMSCGTEVALAEWAPSYRRATWMQAPLAVLGSVCGVLAWLAGSNLWWLVGGALVGLVIPFTFLVIMPTNERLLAPGLNQRSAETGRLLEHWNYLHSIRSLLSGSALIIFLINT